MAKNLHTLRNTRLIPLAAALALCLFIRPGTALSASWNAAHKLQLTTLASFTPTYPDGKSDRDFGVIALIPGSGGSFTMAVAGIGASGDGAVFRIAPSGKLTVLYSFRPQDRNGDMTAFQKGRDGNFYGATTDGGAYGRGVFFRLTPLGKLTILHFFSAKDHRVGANTYYIQGRDGSFYGESYSRALNKSIAYKITPSGAITLLHTFAGGVDQFLPGDNGNFFGVADGAPSGEDTFFMLSPSGQFNTLHTFSDQETGEDGPFEIIKSRDGNFYGIAQDNSSVFKITPSGKFTTVYSFGPDGSPGDPRHRPASNIGDCLSSLIEGRDGALYCTAESGGALDDGTIFRITKSGRFTLLHVFRDIESGPNADGDGPDGLIQGRDGNFYGTAGQDGGLFRMTPSGKLTVLYTFGASSPSLYFQDGNSIWYGKTDFGGTGRGESLWTIRL